MGRVNRLMERRALRRAADQALLTLLGSAASAQPGGAADQDFAYKLSGPAVIEVGDDHEPITAPIPVAGRPDDYGWPVDDEPQPDDTGWNAADVVAVHEEFTPPPAVHPAPAVPPQPLDEIALGHPAVNMTVPEYRPEPWYRTKPAVGVLVASVIVALFTGGWLVLRSPTTTAEQSTIQAPTSAPPAPSTAQPTAVSAPRQSPVPPPPPPLPPPPPPPTNSAPQRQYSEPRYSAPSPTQKPRIDVTRAPMSVAPVPKPVPGSNSSTPGDAPDGGGRRRGCFGFC